MYPRPLLRTIKGEVRERIRKKDNSYVVEQPYSIAVHTTPVFTPVQALRCKIIQTLPPLDVGPSLTRTRINLCVFSCITIWKGDHALVLLVGVIPRGENTDSYEGLLGHFGKSIKSAFQCLKSHLIWTSQSRVMLGLVKTAQKVNSLS